MRLETRHENFTLECESWFEADSITGVEQSRGTATGNIYCLWLDSIEHSDRQHVLRKFINK